MDYKVAGKITDQYTQIGNAVPVRLARIIGQAILEQVPQEEEIEVAVEA